MATRLGPKTYLYLDDVIRQDYQATLNAGFPNDWKGVEPDYGLDPDVIGPDDLFGGRFASQIVDALKAAPTLSLVAEIGDLFDVDRGIYINSVNSGPAWERPVSVEMIYPDGSVGFQENAGIRSGAVRDGTDFAWKALRTASRDVKSNDRQQSNAAYQRLLGKNA